MKTLVIDTIGFIGNALPTATGYAFTAPVGTGVSRFVERYLGNYGVVS